MGRIDAIISDPLETQLRIEVVKRFGGKKGDLQKAVEEAIEMWVNSDVMEKLKQKAMKEGLTVTEMGSIVDAFKQYRLLSFEPTKTRPLARAGEE